MWWSRRWLTEPLKPAEASAMIFRKLFRDISRELKSRRDGPARPWEKKKIYAQIYRDTVFWMNCPESQCALQKDSWQKWEKNVHNKFRRLRRWAPPRMNGIASRAQWAEYAHADVWQSLVLIVGCWVRMCQRECCGVIYEPAFPPCFCLGFTQFYNWQDGTRRISISWRELSLRLCILLNAKLVWRIVIRSGAG